MGCCFSYRKTTSPVSLALFPLLYWSTWQGTKGSLWPVAFWELRLSSRNPGGSRSSWQSLKGIMHGPSRHLKRSFLEDFEPKASRYIKARLVTIKTSDNNVCCVKPWSFRIICHKAINNDYICHIFSRWRTWHRQKFTKVKWPAEGYSFSYWEGKHQKLVPLLSIVFFSILWVVSVKHIFRMTWPCFANDKAKKKWLRYMNDWI